MKVKIVAILIAAAIGLTVIYSLLQNTQVQSAATGVEKKPAPTSDKSALSSASVINDVSAKPKPVKYLLHFAKSFDGGVIREYSGKVVFLIDGKRHSAESGESVYVSLDGHGYHDVQMVLMEPDGEFETNAVSIWSHTGENTIYLMCDPGSRPYLMITRA